MPPVLRPAALLVALFLAGCDTAVPPPPTPPPPPAAFPPAETLSAQLVDPSMIKDVVVGDCASFHGADADSALFHIPMAAALQRACAPMLELTDPTGRQLTVGEWAQASGEVTVECTTSGTRYAFRFDGLIPDGVYTIWHFPPTGGGALASRPGVARNTFTAGADTTTFTVVGTAGTMTMEGAAPACTLPIPPRSAVGQLGGELFVVLYHKDSRSWGDGPGPEEASAGHLVFLGR